jgi:hypothetical protein
MMRPTTESDSGMSSDPNDLKISPVIPAWNEAAYLPRLLDVLRGAFYLLFARRRLRDYARRYWYQDR